MKILSGNNIDRKAWATFVAKHPQGNIFQTPEMYDVYACAVHVTPIAIVAMDGEEIVGVLVAQYMTNGGRLASWITARSIITGGPLVRNNDPAIIQALLEAYKKQLPGRTIYSEIRPVYLMEDVPGWKRVGHYNLVLGLEKTEEELFEQMHKERRRNVNQAVKAGLVFKEVTDEEDISAIVALIKQTYERKHVPIGYLDMFGEVRRLMGEYARFFASYTADGKMIAGEIRLCYNDLVYAWFAGSDEAYLKLRPNDFTMWNVIRWAHEKGYKEFDFGGGGEPGKPYGVRDYKLKYGCEMFDYGRYLLTHRPITYWAAATAYNIYHKLKGK